MKRLFVCSLIAAFLVISFYGCDDDEVVTAPSNNLSFSLQASNVSLAKSFTDTIAFDSIKLLIRDLRFGVCGCNDSTCVKTGTFVVYLKLDGSLNQIALANLPYGTYQKAKFYIHKPEPVEDPPDPAFKSGTGSDERYSVLVYGRYNDSTFVYRCKKSATQEISFDTPVLIGASGITNITLVVNPYTWFKLNGLVLQPNDANNENDIDNNIKTSFLRAFRDNDRNGRPDN